MYCSGRTRPWRASPSSPATAPPSPTATSAASPSWSRTRSWSLCAGSSACSCPATRSGRWRGRSGRSSTTTTFRPRPLLPALAPSQPALRRRHPGRGEALARAPLQPQRAPAAATAMGTVDGGVICGGGLQGEVQGYGKMQDTRLLVLGSSKIFKGWEEDGKQSRGGMAAGKYLWMVWHLHCWNFSDTDYFVKYTESMISILLQIALVRSQQEMV